MESENPFASPEAQITDAVGDKVSRKGIHYLVVGLFPTFVAASLVFFFVPDFIAMYAPAASRLPAQTRFVFSNYYLSALLPVLVLCSWRFWPNPSRRGPWVVGIGFVSSAAVLALCWWAVYQPEIIIQLIKHSSR